MGKFEPEAFGKYYLIDKIATGGMAEIFKAKTFSHGGFENLLVIKRILPHISENDEFIEMFIDEAKVSVALQHPNIVRIYDFGKILDNYFIAMECVDGKDIRNVLRKLARQKKFFPIKFCAFVAHETCRGLQYAHQKTDLQGNKYGIIHRDISPSNVILSYDGDVKVADFGIAKAESNAYQTKDGVLKGKFEYMSPEQASGIPIDHRSDIFSVGIILYEMLTGRRLFKTDSDTATLKKIQNGDFKPPSALNPRIPPELEAIVMKALTLERDDRYQHAQEMENELREFLFPETTATLRDELGAYLKEVFTSEIQDETRRLEDGSAVAVQLKEQAPPDMWDGNTNSTIGGPNTQAASMGPVFAGLGLLFMGIAAIAAAGAYMVMSNQQVEETPIVEELPTTASLDIMVLPKSKITLNGEDKGEHDTLSLADLEPGTYSIKLEAEGYEPLEGSVTLAAGDAERFAKTLVALPGSPEITEAPPEPPPKTPKAPSKPAVLFSSAPSGATVYVDGNRVGTTPMTWTSGKASKTYDVKMELAGHEAATGSVKVPGAGGREKMRLTLSEVKLPGKLAVTLVGGGWANVYVDGTKLKKTAPLKDYPLDPGTYTIRVENAQLGVDHTEQVTVGSGAAITVRARPQ